VDWERRLAIDREPQAREIEVIEIRRWSRHCMFAGLDTRVLRREDDGGGSVGEDKSAGDAAGDKQCDRRSDDKPVATAPSAPADSLELACFDVG
jgi:hypothetical protein